MLRLATILAALALTLPAAAHAATPDQLMARIASQQTMGWRDNKVPFAELQHRINQGRRIYVSCSIVAHLGYLAAVRHGIKARHVSAITNAPFDGYNDGHAMLELRLGGKWVLYDLDLNRVAVDHHGNRIGLAEQVKAGRDRWWRVIAHDDARWNYTGTTAALRNALVPKARMATSDWYQRALGVALVELPTGGYAYHTPRHSPRIENAWPGQYHWVNAQTWRALNA